MKNIHMSTKTNKRKYNQFQKKKGGTIKKRTRNGGMENTPNIAQYDITWSNAPIIMASLFPYPLNDRSSDVVVPSLNSTRDRCLLIVMLSKVALVCKIRKEETSGALDRGQMQCRCRVKGHSLFVPRRRWKQVGANFQDTKAAENLKAYLQRFCEGYYAGIADVVFR